MRHRGDDRPLSRRPNYVATELNARPRQTLDWQAPMEKMNQLLLQ